MHRPHLGRASMLAIVAQALSSALILDSAHIEAQRERERSVSLVDTFGVPRKAPNGGGARKSRMRARKLMKHRPCRWARARA